MADIIPPREYTTVVYHTIKAGGKCLKLTVYSGQYSDTLFFGGHTKFCIDVMVYKPGSPFAERGGDISEGYLSHIYYNTNCSLDGDFSRGVDSTMLLRLMLSYIKYNYPYITKISFNDSSYRVCDNNQSVELSEMSYIRTGKTWYQQHFNAYMDPSDIPKFQTCENRFNNAKSSMSWTELKQYMTKPLPMEEKDMKEMFEISKTWQDFFGTLSDKISIAKFCIFVAPWLHRFLQVEMRYNFNSARFLFPVQSITPIHYELSEYKRGGKRFTEKKRRNRPRNET